jgi:hypothetical protein
MWVDDAHQSYRLAVWAMWSAHCLLKPNVIRYAVAQILLLLHCGRDLEGGSQIDCHEGTHEQEAWICPRAQRPGTHQCWFHSPAQSLSSHHRRLKHEISSYVFRTATTTPHPHKTLVLQAQQPDSSLRHAWWRTGLEAPVQHSNEVQPQCQIAG